MSYKISQNIFNNINILYVQVGKYHMISQYDKYSVLCNAYFCWLHNVYHMNYGIAYHWLQGQG